jgi:hypothetical protein
VKQVPIPRRKPWVMRNCHRLSLTLAKKRATEKMNPPVQITSFGGYRLVHVVENGAPIVIRETARVPIRSIWAGEEPVNGVPSCCDMES